MYWVFRWHNGSLLSLKNIPLLWTETVASENIPFGPQFSCLFVIMLTVFFFGPTSGHLQDIVYSTTKMPLIHLPTILLLRSRNSRELRHPPNCSVHRSLFLLLSILSQSWLPTDFLKIALLFKLFNVSPLPIEWCPHISIIFPCFEPNNLCKWFSHHFSLY